MLKFLAGNVGLLKLERQCPLDRFLVWVCGLHETIKVKLVDAQDPSLVNSSQIFASERSGDDCHQALGSICLWHLRDWRLEIVVLADLLLGAVLGIALVSGQNLVGFEVLRKVLPQLEVEIILIVDSIGWSSWLLI